MAQHTLSLNRFSKGQALIETLFVIVFLLSFSVLLQKLNFTAQTQIQKERLSKHKTKRSALWLNSQEKGEKK